MKQLVHDSDDRGYLVVFSQPSITIGHPYIIISVKNDEHICKSVSRSRKAFQNSLAIDLIQKYTIWQCDLLQ